MSALMELWSGIDRLHVRHERVESEIPYLRCHWCAGTGVHPFAAPRWHQLLANWLAVPEYVDSESGRHRRRWLEGVSEFRPFRLWHLEVAIELALGAQLPYELPGHLACPRCSGWGERYGAERHAEQGL